MSGPAGGVIEIRRMGPGDEERVRQADPLFDDPSHPEAVLAALADPVNYLLIAYLDRQPAGFIWGHLLARLDTPRPQMFLYEVGVAEGYQGRGIGTALVRELARLAEQRGCCEMFVLTHRSNQPAMRLYAAGGATLTPEEDIAMWEWAWE